MVFTACRKETNSGLPLPPSGLYRSEGPTLSCRLATSHKLICCLFLFSERACLFSAWAGSQCIGPFIMSGRDIKRWKPNFGAVNLCKVGRGTKGWGRVRQTVPGPEVLAPGHLDGLRQATVARVLPALGGGGAKVYYNMLHYSMILSYIVHIR